MIFTIMMNKAFAPNAGVVVVQSREHSFSSGLSLFTISMGVLMNAMRNFTVHTRITRQKCCLITLHLSSSTTHLDETPRKIILVAAFAEYA